MMFVAKEQQDVLHNTYYRTLTEKGIMEMKLHKSQLELLNMQKELARKDILKADFEVDIAKYRREILRVECVEARIRLAK